ncbi:MAG: CHAD domain-containing protein [Desulfuromonadales bacterium]
MCAFPLRPAPGQSTFEKQLPVGEALRLICRQQLRAIEQHRPGARLGRDPEELHDLRVAVRRTRSVQSEFRKFFPTEPLERFRTEFRWLGTVTGPVRDLDVYLEQFPAYRALLPVEAAEALEPFRRFLLRQRQMEQRRLVRYLDSLRLRTLLADWQDFLGGADGNIWPERAARPIDEIARRHVWKRYRSFLRQGSATTVDSPDHDLHRLRIAGKKLRYLVEFFRPLYPPAEIELLIKAMKGIQDFLGEYQDCTVQQVQLDAMARQMAAEGELALETDRALAQLVTALRRRQHQLRGKFSARFQVFSRGRGRRGFMRLFAPAGKRE